MRKVCDESDGSLLSGPEEVITNWFKNGAKPRGEESIGVEAELFCFDRKTLTPVAYSGRNGMAAVLQVLLRETGWDAVIEDGQLVGLQGSSASGTSCYSLEPGCQLEFSGAPVQDLHAVADQLSGVLALLRRVVAELNIGLLPIGHLPLGKARDVPRSPQQRRAIMDRFLATRGSRTTETMYCTCSVQVNLDYHDEDDFRRKLRVAHSLQPLATALFAASPFRDGWSNGLVSNRAECWQVSDGERNGPLPFVFQRDFGFVDYIEYALTKEVVARPGPDGSVLAVAGSRSLAQLWSDAAGFTSSEEAIEVWKLHNSFLWPQVRPKPYLELRGADCSPLALHAVAAFWTGLLYDQTSLAAAEAMVMDWHMEEWISLSQAVPTNGLASTIRGASLRDVAKQVVGLAQDGLARRNLRKAGINETQYLADVAEVAESGITWAERLIGEYQTAGGLALPRMYETLAL